MRGRLSSRNLLMRTASCPFASGLRNSSIICQGQRCRPEDEKPRKLDTKHEVTSSANPHETRIGAIKLSVADLDAMARFYKSVFRMKPAKKHSKFISYGMLSLVDARYAEDLSGKAIKPNGETYRHRIGICVGDLDATFACARKGGCVGAADCADAVGTVRLSLPGFRGEHH